MRQERMPIAIDGEAAGYIFFFQIANNGGRRACSIKVEASNVHEATTLFRQNWSIIEAMARDGIKARAMDDSVITLVLP